jgi:uncharacterized protein YndB with AHSA1/START domain
MTPSTLETTDQIDPQLDLVFERIIDISPKLVWAAWTTPKHLLHWFTPVPWETIDCEIDLRPGGIFRTVMRSPEGQEFPNLGCYLELIPNEKLVWTNVFEPGYRPAGLLSGVPEGDFPLTAMIFMKPHEQGTQYKAIVRHGNAADCQKHRDMGFEDGWGKALDQLVEYMKSL